MPKSKDIDSNNLEMITLSQTRPRFSVWSYGERNTVEIEIAPLFPQTATEFKRELRDYGMFWTLSCLACLSCLANDMEITIANIFHDTFEHKEHVFGSNWKEYVSATKVI